MKHSKIRTFLIAFALAIAVIIITCAVLFSSYRWWMVNDAGDVIGTWTIEDSEKQITINDTEIRMSEDVIFTYQLDATSKTITEHLADKTGKVHYVFSKDRNELILIDEDLDFATSTFLDAGNLLSTFFSGHYSDSSAGFFNTNISDDAIVRLKRA